MNKPLLTLLVLLTLLLSACGDKETYYRFSPEDRAAVTFKEGSLMVFEDSLKQGNTDTLRVKKYTEGINSIREGRNVALYEYISVELESSVMESFLLTASTNTITTNHRLHGSFDYYDSLGGFKSSMPGYVFGIVPEHAFSPTADYFIQDSLSVKGKVYYDIVVSKTSKPFENFPLDTLKLVSYFDETDGIVKYVLEGKDTRYIWELVEVSIKR